ncbi:MAG: pyridoxal phosphate-dependent aminotransferase [Muribaculaceae bacterium]|nr:pyridoxal phosphate-dependent aminotransferase [Muribaculaceae bacterium]
MMFDFDTPPSRVGTASYKWDSAEQADVIPLWVADMDFRTAPAIIDALEKRVQHGIFGYVRVPDEYYRAVTDWFGRRHGWIFEREQIIYTSGVVPAISAIIKALCKPGDGVVVQTPVYNCFFSSIRNNGCRVVENSLVRIENQYGTFSYKMNFDELDHLLADSSNRLLLLCNPHNPAGRCWTSEELRNLSEICQKHGVTVVSDEIHCELTMPGYKFVPFATVAGSCKWVTCNSPSKAFNTAGLQIANIISPDADMRSAIDRAININEVCDVNPFGVVGLIAAYTKGEAWLEALLGYIDDNYKFFREFMRTHLPSLPCARLEATYLAWVDIRPLGCSGEEIEENLRHHYGIWVNAGGMYGCDDYVRVNLACPRERLAEGLKRMAEGINYRLSHGNWHR